MVCLEVQSSPFGFPPCRNQLTKVFCPMWLTEYLKSPFEPLFLSVFLSSLTTLHVCLFMFDTCSSLKFATTGASMGTRSSSPPLSDGSSVRSIDGNRYSQTITDQFINSKKFYRRLDRLLGVNEYTCQWRQNSYIIEDAPRTLSPVRASLSYLRRSSFRTLSAPIPRY